MNNLFLLAAIAVLAVLATVQAMWLRQDAAAAELALEQAEWRYNELEKQLDAAEDYIADDLHRDADHDCTATVESAMKRKRTFDEDVAALFGEMPADFVQPHKYDKAA